MATSLLQVAKLVFGSFRQSCQKISLFWCRKRLPKINLFTTASGMVRSQSRSQGLAPALISLSLSVSHTTTLAMPASLQPTVPSVHPCPPRALAAACLRQLCAHLLWRHSTALLGRSRCTCTCRPRVQAPFLTEAVADTVTVLHLRRLSELKWIARGRGGILFIRLLALGARPPALLGSEVSPPPGAHAPRCGIYEQHNHTLCIERKKIDSR
jgi:hypothetical protein